MPNVIRDKMKYVTRTPEDIMNAQKKIDEKIKSAKGIEKLKLEIEKAKLAKDLLQINEKTH